MRRTKGRKKLVKYVVIRGGMIKKMYKKAVMKCCMTEMQNVGINVLNTDLFAIFFYFFFSFKISGVGMKFFSSSLINSCVFFYFNFVGNLNLGKSRDICK